MMDCSYIVFRALHNAPPKKDADEAETSSGFQFFEVPDEELDY